MLGMWTVHKYNKTYTPEKAVQLFSINNSHVTEGARITLSQYGFQKI